LADITELLIPESGKTMSMSSPTEKMSLTVTGRAIVRPARVSAATILGAVILAGCAGQGSPPGGPIDTTPPTIVRTSPDTNAVNVRPERIEIEFSKYVDRRSAEESIFISPYLGGLEYSWSGTEVTITFSDTLRSGVTYVVSVGTDVVDTRQKNRMAKGFSLAFSTGSEIDRGVISGRVFDAKPEGVMVFAYLLRDRMSDTLDPGKTKPDYITQTGRAGAYTLSNLALGPYRVLAVQDEYRNLLYDREVDRYGVAPHDVVLTAESSRVANLWFRLGKEDTTRPSVTGGTALNRHHVQIRFSEELDSIAFASAVMALTDTLETERVPILVQYLYHGKGNYVGMVAGQTLDSTAVYRVRVRNVFDRAGNPIDTAHAVCDFSGSSVRDTSRPQLQFLGLSDSARGVPGDRPLEISFNVPVRQEALQQAILLTDTLRRPQKTVMQWVNATDLHLASKVPLAGREWYQIHVIMDSVSDFYGNRYKDSVRVVKFRTRDLRQTGSISGAVMGLDPAKTRGPVFLSAVMLESSPPESRVLRLLRPGSYLLDRLMEGKYTVSAFLDLDSSGTYSYGRPFPYAPSEPFSVYMDTVKVRARWSVENVTLLFH
jgi:hypothetical protein